MFPFISNACFADDQSLKDELGPRSKFKTFAKNVFGSSKRPPSRDTPLTDSTNQAMDTDANNGTAEPKAKTRKIKKQVRKGELPLSSGTSSLDQQTKDAAAEKEGAMFMEDKLVADTEDKKNELESYIYELRSKIDEQYSEFASDEEKTKLKEKLEQSEVCLPLSTRVTCHPETKTSNNRIGSTTKAKTPPAACTSPKWTKSVSSPAPLSAATKTKSKKRGKLC